MYPSHSLHNVPLAVAITLLSIGALASVPASATTLLEAGVDELAARSELICEGRVASVDVVHLPHLAPHVFTEVIIDTGVVYKGSSDGRIRLLLAGGKSDRGHVVVEGMPIFSAGSEVLVMLERMPRSASVDGEPRYIPMGLWQGHFTLDASSSTFQRRNTGAAMIRSGAAAVSDGSGVMSFGADALRAFLKARITQ